MSEKDIEQLDDQVLSCSVTDDELEMAAGASAGEQGSSLWSSFTPNGCTCVSG